LSAAAKTQEQVRKRKDRERKRRDRAAGGRVVEPTPERYQHGRIEYGECMDAGIKVPQDVWVRQIDRLNYQGKLTDRQRDAGERLYQDWLASGIQKASTGAYEGGSSGSKGRKGGKRPTEAMPASEPFAAYTEAMDSLPGALAVLVRSVVIDDQTPTQASDYIGRGLSRLQEGLDKLADHYGFERNAV
jgi:hypothetical protein